MSNSIFEYNVQEQELEREADKCKNSIPYINHLI